MPASAIYEGSVRHRRNLPRHHEFDFKFFMLLLDLEELPRVLSGWFFSTRRWRLCQFREQDHLRKYQTPTGADKSLRERAIEALRGHGVNQSIGPIRLLTQLSYLGYSMNPVSFYYCYDPAGERVEAIIAEVNNTPWREQHVYVIPSEQIGLNATIRSQSIKKDFHVSPFMTLDMNYRMAFSPPGERLAVKIENHLPSEPPSAHETANDEPVQQKIIDVTMALERRPLSKRSLNWLLIKYPAISFQVVLGIYWQALRLYLKKIPFVPHPGRSSAAPIGGLQQVDSQS